MLLRVNNLIRTNLKIFFHQTFNYDFILNIIVITKLIYLTQLTVDLNYSINDTHSCHYILLYLI
jgi:hypothetical protein